MAPPSRCHYCRLLAVGVEDYPVREAEYDLGSPAPRCVLHWRFICGNCGKPHHFMSNAFCPDTERFYCARCAAGVERVDEPFAVWDYFWRYGSPWTGRMQPSLDRLEFAGEHPWLSGQAEHLGAVSRESALLRQAAGDLRRADRLTDTEVLSLWDKNASPWDMALGPDGDEHRRYVVDAPLLAPLGDLAGLAVLDLGCGNGYLARRLAHRGAKVTAVDVSDEMLRAARTYESNSPLGIAYLPASATDLSRLGDASFDVIVCNHVLTAVLDLGAALAEAARVLRPGGRMAVAISHPAFSCGPRRWHHAAPDTPRREEAEFFTVDDYFRTGPHLLTAWESEGFEPVPYVHRPLAHYWRAITHAGFTVTSFEEPSVSDLGRAELPAWWLRELERVPSSCVFQLARR